MSILPVCSGLHLCGDRVSILPEYPCYTASVAMDRIRTASLTQTCKQTGGKGSMRRENLCVVNWVPCSGLFQPDGCDERRQETNDSIPVQT
jgi:hypothetical protein